MNDGAARPGKQGRYDKLYALVRAGRREGHHMLRPVMAQIKALAISATSSSRACVSGLVPCLASFLLPHQFPLAGGGGRRKEGSGRG